LKVTDIRFKNSNSEDLHIYFRHLQNKYTYMYMQSTLPQIELSEYLKNKISANFPEDIKHLGRNIKQKIYISELGNLYEMYS